MKARNAKAGGARKPPALSLVPVEGYTLHIRNMVCDRCKTVVRGFMAAQGLVPVRLDLGEVVLPAPLNVEQLAQLDADLMAVGFERIDDRKARIIERTKRLILERARGDAMANATRVRLSVELAREMGMEYSGLSKLFSSVEGQTIERYFNLQRIERAKELIVYDELSLSQIADRLGYSSVQHLSNQFSQFVGHSPSHFKFVGVERRKALDMVGSEEPRDENNV